MIKEQYKGIFISIVVIVGMISVFTIVDSIAPEPKFSEGDIVELHLNGTKGMVISARRNLCDGVKYYVRFSADGNNYKSYETVGVKEFELRRPTIP
jgi:hypothetical protein